MVKRIVSIYIEDEVLELIDRLKEDSYLKAKLRKKKLSRSDVLESAVKHYWNSRTLDGMLEV